ncbi:inositol monophosphatase family protein, partial [Micromonospora sp. NPDC000207]|uniref:inositol monophosphatase family protein n=1 Tax=Micromonospora sp. NPDC000207 TaxID=3154246 RepID=UPI0033190CA9
MIDGAFARWLAAQAGQALTALRVELGFADAGALKTAGDKVSHELIRAELAKWRPGDAVLSEEDAGARLTWTTEVNSGGVSRMTADRVWIIDPLDGTREFSEEGRSDWAVHVALWARNASTPHGLVAGAVGLPAQHRVLGTDYPPAYPPMTLEAATSGGGRTIRLAVSRSRPPVFLTDLAEEVGAQLVPMGSAGAKIA